MHTAEECAPAPPREREDRVRSSVEDEERAVGRLTANHLFGEASGDVRRKAPDGSERGLDRHRIREGDGDDDAMLNAEC